MTVLVSAPDWQPVPGLAVARITLDRAERSNALTPDLLASMTSALAAAAARPVDVLVIDAAGRNFSSGGDVALLARAAAAGQGARLAEDLVGGLHRLILALLRLPAVVVAVARGAVTGGAAGLLLASDLVLLADDAFLQPWYGRVGFAPDGGWTALLPEQVGAHRALAMQVENRRLDARAALDLGLADHVVPAAGLEPALQAVLAAIAGTVPGALQAAKRLIWDPTRLARVAARLEAEQAAFAARISCPQTVAGMAAFLGPQRQHG